MQREVTYLERLRVVAFLRQQRLREGVDLRHTSHTSHTVEEAAAHHAPHTSHTVDQQL